MNGGYRLSIQVQLQLSNPMRYPIPVFYLLIWSPRSERQNTDDASAYRSSSPLMVLPGRCRRGHFRTVRAADPNLS